MGSPAHAGIDPPSIRRVALALGFPRPRGDRPKPCRGLNPRMACKASCFGRKLFVDEELAFDDIHVQGCAAQFRRERKLVRSTTLEREVDRPAGDQPLPRASLTSRLWLLYSDADNLSHQSQNESRFARRSLLHTDQSSRPRQGRRPIPERPYSHYSRTRPPYRQLPRKDYH